MATPPRVVAALSLALLALLASPSRGGVLRPRTRRALVYFTQHPTGSSPGSSSSSSAYFATGPEAASLPLGSLSSLRGVPVAGPAVAPAPAPPEPTPPPQGFLPTGGFQPSAQPSEEELRALAEAQKALLQGERGESSPYGNPPPPPPPPPGPAPPYSVSASRGLTYETASQAPPLRSSYAPSARISYGRVGVLARVGYTAPPLAVAAPALLLTSAKDGGLVGVDAPSAYDPFDPAFGPEPYAPPPPPPPRQVFRPAFRTVFRPALRPQPQSLFTAPRGGRVFRPSPPDPSAPSAPGLPSTGYFTPSPSPFGPLVSPSGPASTLDPFDPLATQQPASPFDSTADPPPEPRPIDPNQSSPHRFLSAPPAPAPVTPILLNRNRGSSSYYMDGINYLR